MKKRTFINLITLLITTFLLIYVVRAWYVTNEKASANGIFATAASDAFTLELERGTYNAGQSTKWTWENTNNLSIANMQPGNAFFFRFKITASKTGTFKVTLNEIISSIQNDTLTRLQEGTKYYVGLNSTKIFEMDNATKQTIYSDLSSTKLGVLYNYDEEETKFSLEDFKVEDSFKYYDYGLGNETSFNTQDNKVNNDSTITENAKLLKDVDARYTISDVSTSNVWYGYFALEFNEALSLKTYKHLDGTVKTDSNLFQAQILSIKQFAVEEI